VSAQDPALAPARIIEGIVPWRLNRGNFYVSGLTWEKARARRPWLSFDEFWSDREHIYDYRNADTKRFFAEFQRDPEKHAKVLSEPKPEPVEDMIAPHEFMYRHQGICDEVSS
jgi:hypothetical protein